MPEERGGGEAARGKPGGGRARSLSSSCSPAGGCWAGGGAGTGSPPAARGAARAGFRYSIEIVLRPLIFECSKQPLREPLPPVWSLRAVTPPLPVCGRVQGRAGGRSKRRRPEGPVLLQPEPALGHSADRASWAPFLHRERAAGGLGRPSPSPEMSLNGLHPRFPATVPNLVLSLASRQFCPSCQASFPCAPEI